MGLAILKYFLLGFCTSIWNLNVYGFSTSRYFMDVQVLMIYLFDEINKKL